MSSEVSALQEESKPLPYANKGDLTSGSIRGHLTRMTLPMIWGLFAVIAVQLVDTYFISLLGDTEVLAGFSFTFPVTMIISHFVFGLNIALSSVASRLIGQKLFKDTNRIVLHAIFLAVGVSAIIALTTFTFMKPLFFMLGADEATYPIVAQYMPYWLISSVILAIPVNANSAMRAAGDTVIPAIVMTSLAIVNAILDPILIFGYFGFEAMGVKGAALATLIATASSTLVAMYFLIFKKKLIATDGLHLDLLKDSIKRLIVIAIPAGIGNIIMPMTGAIIIALLASHGPEAVAAYGIVSRVEALSMILVIALATGMAPIIGQNWGAKLYDRVRQTIRDAIWVNLIWSAIVALILGVFATLIAWQFSNDPLVIEYASLFFWIVPFSYGIGNLVFGWAAAFNAMGMPQKAFILIFSKAILLSIPAIYLGSWVGGVTGIFIAIAAVNVIAGLASHFISKHNCSQCEKES